MARWGSGATRFPSCATCSRGAELADSWATDGHKWLNVPYDWAMRSWLIRSIIGRRWSIARVISTHADEARDQLDWTPEHSRRARGFSTCAALRELGRSGLCELVARCCRHAHAIVTRIGALPNARTMVWEPQINQGLVRFSDPRTGATEEDHDGGPMR